MGKKMWHFDTVHVYEDWDPEKPDSPYIFFDHKDKGLRLSLTRPESQESGIQPGEPAALVLLTGDDLEELGS